MKIFVIKFNTLNFGRGVAVVISDTMTHAFELLKSGGRLNGYNNQYQELNCVEVGKSTIDQPIIVEEVIAQIE